MDKQTEKDPKEREFVTSERGGESLRARAAHRVSSHQQIIIDHWESDTDNGIGLAICRKVVGPHGGKIRADSMSGRGSTFYSTVPQVSQRPEGYH